MGRVARNRGSRQAASSRERLPLRDGTSAVRRVHASLTVNEPGDRYEEEADRVADQVMRMPAAAPRIQRSCDASGLCAAPAETLQRQDDAGSGRTATPEVDRSLRSSGRPMAEPVRSSMEQRFGADFGGVRLHTDAAAADAARSIQAQAFTHGEHIAFDAGRYRPESRAGQRLLAHELTHVLQQQPSDRVQRTPDEDGDGNGGTSILSVARTRQSGDLGDAYDWDPGWWYSPNPDLAGARREPLGWEENQGAERKDGEWIVNWGAGQPTCNLYVYDVLHAAGKNPPLMSNDHYYDASRSHEGADGYLTEVGSRSDVQPGDIFTSGIHMEIIVSVSDGGNSFASAGAHQDGAYIEDPSPHADNSALKFWRVA